MHLAWDGPCRAFGLHILIRLCITSGYNASKCCSIDKPCTGLYTGNNKFSYLPSVSQWVQRISGICCISVRFRDSFKCSIYHIQLFSCCSSHSHQERVSCNQTKIVILTMSMATSPHKTCVRDVLTRCLDAMSWRDVLTRVNSSRCTNLMH